MIIKCRLWPCYHTTTRAFSPSRQLSILSRRVQMANTLRAGPRDYKAAVAALNALPTNFSIIDAIGKSGRSMNDLAIPEMQDWCRRIGYETKDLDILNPIHIAGTKGKGSTSAFISSILFHCRAAGSADSNPQKIGLYTSPHLRTVQERIQIDNTPLSESAFVRYFFEVWDRLEASAAKLGPQNISLDGEAAPPNGSSPTGPTKPIYFRYLTLMALHAFASEGVSTAVIECGIGGEYDSTNILVSPSVSAVTSLGIDHTSILGETIEDIAWHKAGIFKASSRSKEAYTVSTQPAAALAVLKRRAEAQGLTLVPVPRHPVFSETSSEQVTLGLAADFQKTNASLAIAVAAAHLRAQGFTHTTSGAPLPDPTEHTDATLPPEFRRGLELVQWSGRCEVRRQGNIAWHLDGGHTMDSIRLAAEWFGGCVAGAGGRQGRGRRVLLFSQPTRDAKSLAGALHQSLRETLSAAGTDAEQMSDAPLFDRAVFCTNVRFKPKTPDPGAAKLDAQTGLAGMWEQLDRGSEASVEPTIEEAVRAVEQMEEAYGRHDEGDGEIVVLVTGSLHLVGGVLEVLDRRAATNAF